MNPRRRAAILQQRRSHHLTSNADAYAFFSLLTGPELFEQVDSLLPDHRERLFPPTETLSMFMAQALSADRSCQRAVNELAIKQLRAGLKPCSTHTGGYCRARQRLPVEMVSSLVRNTRGKRGPREKGTGKRGHREKGTQGKGDTGKRGHREKGTDLFSS